MVDLGVIPSEAIGNPHHPMFHVLGVVTGTYINYSPFSRCVGCEFDIPMYSLGRGRQRDNCNWMYPWAVLGGGPQEPKVNKK